MLCNQLTCSQNGCTPSSQHSLLSRARPDSCQGVVSLRQCQKPMLSCQPHRVAVGLAGVSRCGNRRCDLMTNMLIYTAKTAEIAQLVDFREIHGLGAREV